MSPLFSGNIVDISNSSTFELYVIKDDLKVNPIPGNALDLRTQAVANGYLCSIQIPVYTDTEPFLSAVKSSITGSDCGLTICRSQGCTARLAEDGDTEIFILCDASNNCDGMADIQEYTNCDCDVVVTVDTVDDDQKNFALYTGETITISIESYHWPLMFTQLPSFCIVSYKADEVTANDIKLIGIFDEDVTDKVVSTQYFGIPINNPSYPAIVPRFKSMQELTASMSQAITNFTNVPTTITAEYISGSETEAGRFILGLQVEKSFDVGVSFSASLSLGDFSTLSVDESRLSIGGSLKLYNEFGVILGPDGE